MSKIHRVENPDISVTAQQFEKPLNQEPTYLTEPEIIDISNCDLSEISDSNRFDRVKDLFLF